MREYLKLTGITRASGVCACCNKSLGTVFELSDGNTYGRKCAGKLTGFSVTDKALRSAQKQARIKTERIAARWGRDEFVQFARASEGCWDDVMVYAPGKPHVIDWADQQVEELYR